MPNPKHITVNRVREGNLYGIIYHEPAYSYVKNYINMKPPHTITTFGKLRRNEKDFIDILIQWPEKNGAKGYEGLVIPKNFIKKIIPFKKP